MTKFAVFDIDGTIFRWQLYHELFDELKNAGHVKNGDTALQARKQWQERTLSYDEYEQAIVDSMNESIAGIDVSELETIADRIMTNKGSQTYTYTLNLLRSLKDAGYLTIAVSGSHQQLVDRFCTLHGIDIGVGRRHVVKDGKLTADSEATIGRKHEIVARLIEEHQLDVTDSYAVGDSAGDISMLRLVEHPIAFNPASELLVEAMANGWPVVIERKSIAYELKKGNDGSYVLAAPNA